MQLKAKKYYTNTCNVNTLPFLTKCVNRRKRGMNVSLVYNNKKLIGKCSKFAIEKVQGTSPFVMLENFEPKQPQLNENQQQVLGWLKTGHCSGDRFFEALERVTYVYEDPKTEESLESLSPDQEVQVITTFMQWALEQEEE